MKEFYEKNKQKVNIILAIIVVLLVVYLMWALVISKKVIFNKQVENIGQAGEKYFGTYSNKLPKKEKDVVSISAKELMEKSFAKSSDLYIPKTKKSCDLEGSWVKARMENGKIQYYTYLKCGKYENDVDHEGPIITLNGKESEILGIGEVYKEPGVKSIKDNKDGEIDANNITIKNNVIDSSEPNTYQISYIAYDSLKNKTEVKREVKVVKKLENIIKDDTNGKNYYSGIEVNNYVQFSGMLWQMVGLNEDGTVKLVSNASIANVTYGKGKSYNKTNIYKWLNDYFYNHLTSKDYIVKGKWCVANVQNGSDTGCKETVKANVGLLTVNEYSKANTENGNYLNPTMMGSYWLANKKDTTNAWAMTDIDGLTTLNTTDITTTKPVINLKKGVYANSGDGSSENPYVIGDYKTGKPNSKLSERIVGEVVNYSGHSWRVMEHDKDTTTLIMVESVYNTSALPVTYSYTTPQDTYKFDLKDKKSIGYQISRDINKYLVEDSKILENEWEIDEFDSSKNYDKFKTSKIKAKYILPKTYEMFSAASGYKSWLLDYSKKKGNILFVGPGGRGFDINIDQANENSVKLIVKLSNKATISSGSGTYNDPYNIK